MGSFCRVAAKDSALVRYDADEEEIKALASTDDGTLFFGTVKDPEESMGGERINGLSVITIDGSSGGRCICLSHEHGWRGAVALALVRGIGAGDRT